MVKSDSNPVFYRDGYTDLRGRFDYALSSSSDINNIDKFSILICSEELGIFILFLLFSYSIYQEKILY
jgi:hypothetical protein